MIAVSKSESVVKQAWLAKQDAIIYFGYTNHKSVFQKLLKEFKEHEDYKKGFIAATTGVPIVEIEMFKQFLQWRETNKYKRDKEVRSSWLKK